MNNFRSPDEYDVTPLFSVPLYEAYVNIPPVNESKISWTTNMVNQISDNQYILNEPEYQQLRDDIYVNLKTYWRHVMNATCEAEPEITHSWFNVTYPGQSHHKHRHPNSYISGVLFWQYHDSAITFDNDRYNQIEYETDCSTPLNSNTWSVHPQPGLLLLFPSYQSHSVKPVHEGQEPRLSLSFDTWLRGDVNSIPNQQLTIG